MYDFDFDKGRKKEKEKKEKEKFSGSKPRHFPRKWPRQKKGQMHRTCMILVTFNIRLTAYLFVC